MNLNVGNYDTIKAVFLSKLNSIKFKDKEETPEIIIRRDKANKTDEPQFSKSDLFLLDELNATEFLANTFTAYKRKFEDIVFDGIHDEVISATLSLLHKPLAQD